MGRLFVRGLERPQEFAGIGPGVRSGILAEKQTRIWESAFRRADSPWVSGVSVRPLVQAPLDLPQLWDSPISCLPRGSAWLCAASGCSGPDCHPVILKACVEGTWCK